MEDFADRYGSRFMKLVDSHDSGKEFEFDQVLLMPTAEGYRALWSSRPESRSNLRS